ncbi:hypothetical protein L6164_001424 [Bauhinia variegata]|uniref:Uncharacterized protein n=1 Tax=Bauhinia variegata TaxID=167791 RepID=A0ACB9Q9C0_BAUVA|nr:hypothetical protein L6164_001424 [Bauhinia variegata]
MARITSNPASIDFENDWIVDSSCGHHVTGDASKFSSLHSYQGKDAIVTADNTVHYVEKEGTVVISGRKVNSITLNNVYHVPGMTKNLFSVSNAVDAGNYVLFGPKDVKFLRNIDDLKADVVHASKRVNDVYVLSTSTSFVEKLSGHDIASIWHAWLGHLNMTKFKVMGKQTMKNLYASKKLKVSKRFMQAPRKPHLEAAKKILKYVNITLDMGLFYKKKTEFSLLGFTDANFAGDLDDQKSTSGHVFLCGSTGISWCSKKQDSVSLSAQEYIWLRRLIEDLHHDKVESSGHKSTTLFESRLCHNDSRGKSAVNNQNKKKEETCWGWRCKPIIKAKGVANQEIRTWPRHNTKPGGRGRNYGRGTSGLGRGTIRANAVEASGPSDAVGTTESTCGFAGLTCTQIQTLVDLLGSHKQNTRSDKLSGNKFNNGWMLDNGVSNHMTGPHFKDAEARSLQSKND